jgi:hypothetical protein
VNANNPIIMKEGYAPAVLVAARLNKSLSTVHRMVRSGRVEGANDGRALYVKVASLVSYYEASENTPLIDASRALDAECRAIAAKLLNGSHQAELDAKLLKATVRLENKTR